MSFWAAFLQKPAAFGAAACQGLPLPSSVIPDEAPRLVSPRPARSSWCHRVPIHTRVLPVGSHWCGWEEAQARVCPWLVPSVPCSCQLASPRAKPQRKDTASHAALLYSHDEHGLDSMLPTNSPIKQIHQLIHQLNKSFFPVGKTSTLAWVAIKDNNAVAQASSSSKLVNSWLALRLSYSSVL